MAGSEEADRGWHRIGGGGIEGGLDARRGIEGTLSLSLSFSLSFFLSLSLSLVPHISLFLSLLNSDANFHWVSRPWRYSCILLIVFSTKCH